MDEDQTFILQVVAVVIVALFGITFLVKLFLALLSVSLSISNLVIGLFNLVINILGLIIGFFVPILAIGFLALIGIILFNFLIDNIKKTAQLIREPTSDYPERILEIFLAGVVQVLLLLLSKDFTTTSMKVVLSIYLWTFVTILLMITSTGNSRKKTVGKIILFLISISLAGFAALRYHLYEFTQLKQIVQQVWQEMLSLPLQDALSLLLILVFLIAMLFGVAYFGFKREN